MCVFVCMCTCVCVCVCVCARLVNVRREGDVSQPDGVDTLGVTHIWRKSINILTFTLKEMLIRVD